MSDSSTHQPLPAQIPVRLADNNKTNGGEGVVLAATTEDSGRLARLRSRDNDAWDAWFQDHGPRVWTYVSRMTGADSATVADMVQEVFLAAARGLCGFDAGRGTLISWLLTIAHRQAALFWRQQSRRHNVLESLVTQTSLSLFDESVSHDFENHELSDAVRDIVSRMTEDAGTLLVRRYLDDRSTAELAIEFGITEQAVRSRLSRARERFRELFESAHEEFVPH